ncbi:MAG: AsmA family protein [Nitrospiraceae bacterium]
MGTRVNIVIGAVVAAGLLVVVAMHLWLGTLVQTAIVQIGSRLTKTTVKVEDVHIGLLSGLVQLDEVEIGNPPGFTAPNAVRLNMARIRLDVLSALSDTVIIDEILVEAPDITFEGLPTSNLSMIQDNVTAAVPAGASKPADSKPAKPAASGSKKFLIKKIALTNGRVAASVGDRRLRLSLPDIHLTDIGKETGGATPEQVVSAVFSAITRSATGAVTDRSKKAGDDASKAAESLKRLFK